MRDLEVRRHRGASRVTGRPSLPIGTYGEISTVEIEQGVFRARAHVADLDGVARRVERRGKSRAAARNALTAAIAERFKAAGGGELLTPDSKVAEVAAMQLERWRDMVAAGKRAPRTLEAYEESLRLHILPALGALRLRETTPGRCEAWLVRLQRTTGPSAAKRARTVLSGVLGLATRMDALPSNPVRDLSPVASSDTARESRALTAAERVQWLAHLDTHAARPPSQRAKPGRAWADETVIANQALGDITRFMLGTGVRIGEAMALSWDEVDFSARTVTIRWHLVAVRGQGLQRMPGTKGKPKAVRVLRVPLWLNEMLAERSNADLISQPVFPDLLGGWRDPNLVMRWLRWSRDEADFPWLTSHRFRQTLITFLDDGDLGTRELADQVGHSKIAQTQAYMARRVASSKAAELLESMLDGPAARADEDRAIS